MSRWVSAVGLSLTLIGALIQFNLTPTKAQTTVALRLWNERVGKIVNKVVQRQRLQAGGGFALIAVGSALQIVALWLPP